MASSTMFQGANNIQITNGQFSILNHNSNNTIQQRTVTYHNQGTKEGVELLREHCATSALLDSKERFDPPRCSEETREALIAEILAWIYGPDKAASMAWLFGGAGAGKSALGQTVAELCQREGRHAGSFFFSRTSTAERSDGSRLVPTLVFQLLETFPDLQPYIEECISRHFGLFDRSAKTQMDLLFIKPLTALKERVITNTTEVAVLSQPRLIFIDGLDECNGQDVQINLLRTLANAIAKIPIPLRFLIASRPEGHITRTIEYDDAFKTLDVRRIDLGNDENAEADIRRFLVRGFQEIHRSHPLRSLLSPSWPSEETIMALVWKSSSHFIYAATVIKYIQYPRGRPDQRLDVILGILSAPATDKPFAQLDALYTHIFMSIDEADRPTIILVFGVYDIILRDEFGYTEDGCLAMIESYMGMQTGELNILLEPLSSLVWIPEDRNGEIKIYHASLFDFLLDSSRSGVLHLNREKAHNIFSQYWLNVLQTYRPPLGSDLKGDDITRALSYCRAFLCYSYRAKTCLSDEARTYLYLFDYLYSIIFHPAFMLKFRTTQNLGGINRLSTILQLFLTVILEKGFDDSQNWHTFHVTRIIDRLQSICGVRDLRFDQVHESLFKEKIYQEQHSVYNTLLNVLPSLAIGNVYSVSEILLSRIGLFGPGTIETDLRSHFLVLNLPYLTSKDVQLCAIYHNLTGYSRGSYDAFEEILRQRVVEYLQRVDGDADPEDLRVCKEEWRIHA